jgi:SSS family solute:Na+ symporter
MFSSVWLCVYLYLPVSLLFFILGSSLYAYYQSSPDLLNAVRMQAAAERLPQGSLEAVSKLASTLTPAEYGDKVMPHFMVNKVPVGLLGLIVAAIMSAAMSTISSGMNASATVFSEDIYKRYVKSDLTQKQSMRLLYIATTGDYFKKHKKCRGTYGNAYWYRCDYMDDIFCKAARGI